MEPGSNPVDEDLLKKCELHPRLDSLGNPPRVSAVTVAQTKQLAFATWSISF